jgi:lipopolysaccharide transport protein LptA
MPTPQLNPTRRTALLAAGCLTLVLGLATSSPAQRLVEGKGFKFAEYFDPPHETQMKSLLEGSRGVPRANNRAFLISDAKVQSFRENGEGELIVEAPECLYNADERTVSSSGLLRLRSADGQFFLEGTGFLWRQTNSSLVVSNNVRTVVKASLVNRQAGASTNAVPAQLDTIEIFSDRFDYAKTSGQGVYRGHVRVTGTNLALVAGTLTVDIPMQDRRLERLVATENVVVDYIVDGNKTQARGQRVTYEADNDTFRVTGAPSWRADEREGRGDELLLDRKSGVFESTGNAWLKMPSRGSGGASFIPTPNAKPDAKASTNQWVEIYSDRYTIRTNSAVFSNDVRVIDTRDDKAQARMFCGVLTATFAGTNELRELVADKNVVMESETNRFAAGHALYTGSNAVLVLTDNPSWRTGARDGRGDLIIVGVQALEMTVRSNAVMRLPADEMRATDLAGGRPARKAAAVALTNQYAVITCDEYFVSQTKGQFRRNVRIEHPQMTWGSDLITTTMDPQTRKIPRMVAEGDVFFNVVDDHGQNMHGTGDHSVYLYDASTTRTNETLELIGSPALVTVSTNIVGQNKTILVDLTRHKVQAPGRYSIRGTVETPTETALPTDAIKR